MSSFQAGLPAQGTGAHSVARRETSAFLGRFLVEGCVVTTVHSFSVIFSAPTIACYTEQGKWLNVQ